MKKRLSSRNSIESLGEFGLISRIKKHLRSQKGVVFGIGDDAAVLIGTGKKYQLFTIDTIVEDVDFVRRKATPEQIGWKALAINLSDIAAMGGVPKSAVVSLTLPRDTSVRFVDGFYKGIRDLAQRFHVAIVGGDFSRGSKIVSSIALLGEVEKSRVVFRNGSRTGDLICVTGKLGGSILGKHLNFIPRLKEGRFLAEHGVSSMIDISDGFIQDLHHLVSENRLGFVIDEKSIPISRAARKLARANYKKSLYHALYDGEDFELLFTVSPSRFRIFSRLWRKRFSTPLAVVGKVARSGRKWPMPGRHLGFQHF